MNQNNTCTCRKKQNHPLREVHVGRCVHTCTTNSCNYHLKNCKASIEKRDLLLVRDTNVLFCFQFVFLYSNALYIKFSLTFFTCDSHPNMRKMILQYLHVQGYLRVNFQYSGTKQLYINNTSSVETYCFQTTLHIFLEFSHK